MRPRLPKPHVTWPVVVGLALALAGVVLFVVPEAEGGRKRKNQAVDTDPDSGAIEPVQTEPEPTWGALFPDPPPLDAGPMPEGLANLSAQGCNACHHEAHDGWADTAHATGWDSSALRAAAADAGTPACLSCHLPLRRQHDRLAAYDGGDPTRPVWSNNPGYDPILHTEGVTCAACHVRDGKVVTSRPVQGAPHPTVWSKDLTDSLLCATCHQLTWPEADRPFYDTWGEWSRSAYAEAGVSCQDCHMRDHATASGPGTGHHVTADRARAVSLLVRVDTVELIRGGEPVTATVTLQNTGAGHAFPTGTPYRGVRLTGRLVGADAKDGSLVEQGTPLVVDLARTIGEQPPWPTTADTRLGAGEQRSWTWPIALDREAPAAEWHLELGLEETMRGEVQGPPFVLRTVPLRVD